MNKIITIVILLSGTFAFGQSYYRFSDDILSQIESDTLSWKYQAGAAKLSFSGYFQETLKAWDKTGVREHKTSDGDSLYFANSLKISAKDYVIEQSKFAQIIIINEAHHIPKHRIFTKSLLQGLYDNGYRYLGLEALYDTAINQRKFPVIESGYYTKEPEFGNLIYEALKIGFTLYGYEASKGKNGKEREIEQADNIQNFIKSAPAGKVLIHCGYAHAYENDYPSWEKAMAGRLKEKMGVDPFTIDQTLFLESFETENNHLFMRLNKSNEPIVLIDENGKVFNGIRKIKHTDIVIIHPETEYINTRPDWLIKDKREYKIPSYITDKYDKLLVMAYRQYEFDFEGIPADIIEITDKSKQNSLYLNRGDYTIVIKDENYNIVEKYDIVIN